MLVCTTAVHNTAQNSSDNLAYPPDSQSLFRCCLLRKLFNKDPVCDNIALNITLTFHVVFTFCTSTTIRIVPESFLFSGYLCVCDHILKFVNRIS